MCIYIAVLQLKAIEDRMITLNLFKNLKTDFSDGLISCQQEIMNKNVLSGHFKSLQLTVAVND